MFWCSKKTTPEKYLKKSKKYNDDSINWLTQAIEAKSAEWCLFSDEKDIFLRDCYYNRGLAYKQQAQDNNHAMKDFIEILKNTGWQEYYPQNGLTLFKVIGDTLDTMTKKDFTGMDKYDVFNAIKALADSKIQKHEEKSLNLLQQCLDQNTPLGKLMWKQRWGTPCSIEKGVLKKIVDLKEELEFKQKNKDDPRLFSTQKFARNPIVYTADYRFRR